MDNSRKFDLQFAQISAVSGEKELQREHVCMAGLLEFLAIVLWAVGPAKVFAGFLVHPFMSDLAGLSHHGGRIVFDHVPVRQGLDMCHQDAARYGLDNIIIRAGI